MRRIRDLAAAIWEFVAGDDWVTAAGVVAGLGVTALVSSTSSAWIVMPLAVALLLALSIWRRVRGHGSRDGQGA
jgi:hypothetical protein